MPSRYHPIEDGLWDDPKFDAQGELPEAPGDERGFFAFLSSNKFQRVAGIYRATDGELAEAYRWPVAKVRKVMASLIARRLIVRDGSWIFLPGYWKRQAHNDGMLVAARKSVMACSSQKILTSFSERYPLHKEWLPNGWQTVGEPMNENASADAEQLQSRAVTEQSRAEGPLPDRLVTVWNTATERSRRNGLPGLIPCRVLTESRASKVKQRLAEEPDLDWWTQAIDKLAVSRFARGSPSKDGRSWRASFDWLIANDTNATKAYEGKYDDATAV